MASVTIRSRVRPRSRILVLFDGKATWRERLVLAEITADYFVWLTPAGETEQVGVASPDIGDIRCHNIQYSGRLVRLSSRKCKDEGTEAMLREYLGGVGTTLLEKFADLRLTMYKYKAGCGGDPDEWHIGFIAEEVLEVSTVT